MQPHRLADLACVVSLRHPIDQDRAGTHNTPRMNPSELGKRIQETTDRIQPVAPALIQYYQARLDNLTKPRGSLGRLEEVAARFAAIRHPEAEVPKGTICTFAADHGIARQGVSLYPREVTAQMVYNFLGGGAAINVLCRHYGLENRVVDVGVDHEFERMAGLVEKKVARGTKDFSIEHAMTREQAERSIQAGMEVAADAIGDGARLLGTGEMGIGNTTSSSAVASAIAESDPDSVTGHGTGIDEKARLRKVEIIRAALKRHGPRADDPLDILAKVGGFEIGAIVGLILESSARRVPVVVDGFISMAAAGLAVLLCGTVREYLFFSHCSVERGHRILLDRLQARPLLDLQMRLGEGTGAAIAMDLVRASVKLMNEMATFDEAQVSDIE